MARSSGFLSGIFSKRVKKDSDLPVNYGQIGAQMLQESLSQLQGSPVVVESRPLSFEALRVKGPKEFRALLLSSGSLLPQAFFMIPQESSREGIKAQDFEVLLGHIPLILCQEEESGVLIPMYYRENHWEALLWKLVDYQLWEHTWEGGFLVSALSEEAVAALDRSSFTERILPRSDREASLDPGENAPRLEVKDPEGFLLGPYMAPRKVKTPTIKGKIDYLALIAGSESSYSGPAFQWEFQAKGKEGPLKFQHFYVFPGAEDKPGFIERLTPLVKAVTGVMKSQLSSSLSLTHKSLQGKGRFLWTQELFALECRISTGNYRIPFRVYADLGWVLYLTEFLGLPAPEGGYNPPVKAYLPTLLNFQYTRELRDLQQEMTQGEGRFQIRFVADFFRLLSEAEGRRLVQFYLIGTLGMAAGDLKKLFYFLKPLERGEGKTKFARFRVPSFEEDRWLSLLPLRHREDWEVPSGYAQSLGELEQANRDLLKKMFQHYHQGKLELDYRGALVLNKTFLAEFNKESLAYRDRITREGTLREAWNRIPGEKRGNVFLSWREDLLAYLALADPWLEERIPSALGRRKEEDWRYRLGEYKKQIQEERFLWQPVKEVAVRLIEEGLSWEGELDIPDAT